MEIVVLSSDIARLVLDYLKSQKLKKATHTFCKTSPYLRQEFSAYKQGLQAHSFFPELEEIICEYVKISRTVEQLYPQLKEGLRSQLQQCKLSEKVNRLLEFASHVILDSNVNGNKNDGSNNPSAIPALQSNNNADEQDGNQGKRKRNLETSNNSSNDEVVTNANTIKRHKMTSSRLGHSSNKRRVLQPFCFLSSKAIQRHKRRYYSKVSTTTDEDAVEEENEEASQSSFEDVNGSASEECDMSKNNECDVEEIFDGQKPTTESTPRAKSHIKSDLRLPILPEISQAILDNSEFQQKLVENINQALNKSTENPKNISETGNLKKSLTNDIPSSGDVGNITSSQLLDQMVKNILEATEKDPSFDDIIQDVVDASNKPQVQSAAIQCNINTTTLPVVGNPPLYTATEPPPLVPAQPVAQLQQFPPTILPTTLTSNRNISNIPITNIPPPRTPIILRSAPAAPLINTPVTSGSVLSAQDPSSMLSNNSFGPLIDPNFSISKLIVLNSNDSAQKQHPENCIGNTTADNLINQLSTTGVVDANDEQVFFDTNTGQITFPVFITNDGIITNVPFIFNSEFVNQQLQCNNIGNLEGSRPEIPLSEPILVSSNQLPPNSIILGSVQKENIVEKTFKEVEIKHCNTVPPATLDNRLLSDKVTPSSSGICNAKAFKSLSTPRKRTSHIRTLTFSPRDPQSSNNVGTPLSTRREATCNLQKSLPKVLLKENEEKSNENQREMEEKESSCRKAVIETIEILPTMTNTANENLRENTNVSTNNTNIPHLFVSEESSNQTIINKHLPTSTETLKEPLESKALSDIGTQSNNTPKRKRSRKTAVRACKRQLSKCSSENELSEEKAEKENEQNTESLKPTDTGSTKDNMMEEWVRHRNCTVALDVRLREINAQSKQANQVKKINTKKRVRRKKPAAIKKKEKERFRKAEELEKTKDMTTEAQQRLLDQDIESVNEEQPIDENKTCVEGEQNDNTEINLIENENEKNVTMQSNSDNATDQNTAKHAKKHKDKGKKCEGIAKKSENKPATTNAEVAIVSGQVPAPNDAHHPHANEALEREKRTTNIALLLETPFKDPNLASYCPPTPGIFAPSLETPASKLRDPYNEMQASASFLFGSITKSELDTPILSALTPGFRLTPFGLKDMGTPKSAPGTDYSSGGGSYYKPDESEDLDRNIDKMLRNSAQKRDQVANDIDCVEQEVQVETGNGEKNNSDSTEAEMSVEKLKVEPIVLKRVKSFGSDTAECIETVNIDPHYTLVSGLPETSAAEEECLSSSSSSSNSSSSSKSSSSSSSSSSTSSSSSSNRSVESKTVLVASPIKKGIINDLENLSDISSTEDEEWQKLTVTDNDENSQLVNNDGEVRYPVRSWLTPHKENTTTIIVQNEITQTTILAKPATIKVNLPLKSAEKRNRQVKELELKKQRIKEKLKVDASTITKKDKPTTSATAAPNISAALAASRMLYAMRDKGKKPSCYQLCQYADTTAVESLHAVQEKRSLDVLTALNLSAKKHLPKSPENPPKITRILPEDDCALTSAPTNLKEKTKINNSLPNANKTPPRKCLAIEARPVTRTIRKTGKKIVRTPLAFKVINSPGKINSHSTTTTLAELTAIKSLNKIKEVPTPSAQHTLRVSPRLMKPSKLGAKKLSETPTAKSKTITRSAKTSSATTKSKGTRSRNNKKESTQAPLENKMNKVMNDSKEESFEKQNDEDEPKQNSLTTIKPKINLKSRNPAVKKKQKPIAKQELSEAPKLEANKSEKNVLAEYVQSGQQKMILSIPKTVYLPPHTVNTDPAPPSTTRENDSVNIDDDDDDDPLEDCEITTIDETDTSRFIKYTYKGPDGPPPVPPKQYDFSNFQMVVAIDENEKHIWRITDGISLFSCAPTLIKPAAIIPKKRKIRATTVTSIITESTPTAQPIPTTSTTNTKIAPLKAFSTNTPTATSTPVINQIFTSKTIDKNVKANSFSEDRSSKPQADQESDESKEFLPETSNETPKIQIEDIESILSHLHGT